MALTKWYKKPEMIVALSAVMISVVTAFIGIYSAFIDRAYARASVWPRVEIFRSYDKDLVAYGVTNTGTGPAIIKQVKVTHNNNIMRHWSDIPQIDKVNQSYLANRILPSQLTLEVILSNDKEAKLRAADSSIGIEICYCSIYQECWVIDRGNQAKETASCIINENEQFLD